jgi:hypothetical protein
MRTHKIHALFHILLLSFLWAIGTFTQAAEHEGLYNLHTVKNADGLVTVEPRISQQELNNALIESKQLISTRRHNLESFIAENRITAQTGAIAAVMPGGLIYLAVRQARLSSANEKLESLQADMNALKSDVLALHEEAPILVARFP